MCAIIQLFEKTGYLPSRERKRTPVIVLYEASNFLPKEKFVNGMIDRKEFPLGSRTRNENGGKDKSRAEQESESLSNEKTLLHGKHFTRRSRWK